MSIRRRSCDICYKRRRRCDLIWPTCTRCEENNKLCHYAYPPQLDARNAAARAARDTLIRSHTRRDDSSKAIDASSSTNWGSVQSWLDHGSTPQSTQLMRLSIPRNIGYFRLLPVVDGKGWPWLLKQIQDYPIVFAKDAETPFIHKSLYRNAYPDTLRAAFGASIGCASIKRRKDVKLYKAIDNQISRLLSPASPGTLQNDLAQLQAIVLYQIIRLCYGDLEQRIVAERQEFHVRSQALALLNRVQEESRKAHQTWEIWVLLESIRRTVVIAFKLYSSYRYYTHGICSEKAAISMLPVSSKIGSWTSEDRYSEYPGSDNIMSTEEFRRSGWAAASGKGFDPFEMLILVGCGADEEYAMVSRRRSLVG